MEFKQSFLKNLYKILLEIRKLFLEKDYTAGTIQTKFLEVFGRHSWKNSDGILEGTFSKKWKLLPWRNSERMPRGIQMVFRELETFWRNSVLIQIVLLRELRWIFSRNVLISLRNPERMNDIPGGILIGFLEEFEFR